MTCENKLLELNDTVYRYSYRNSATTSVLAHMSFTNPTSSLVVRTCITVKGRPFVNLPMGGGGGGTHNLGLTSKFLR